LIQISSRNWKNDGKEEDDLFNFLNDQDDVQLLVDEFLDDQEEPLQRKKKDINLETNQTEKTTNQKLSLADLLTKHLGKEIMNSFIDVPLEKKK